jgi:hypothetical protein
VSLLLFVDPAPGELQLVELDETASVSSIEEHLQQSYSRFNELVVLYEKLSREKTTEALDKKRSIYTDYLFKKCIVNVFSSFKGVDALNAMFFSQYRTQWMEFVRFPPRIVHQPMLNH